MDLFNLVIYLSGIILVFFMLKKLSFTKILLCLCSGIAALLACDVIFSMYGENMPINIYTLLFGGIGGIPGVILLVLLKTVFL